MVTAVPDVLARIVEHKKLELTHIQPRRSSLEQQAANSAATKRNFRQALMDRSPAIIAEAKKASPSKGLLAPGFDPAAIARAYQAGGAAALSVLTDERFFQGSLADLAAARAAAGLPVLRKDFTIDELHVIEAAAHDADAILLIAAILTTSQLRRYRELAETYGMAALVEVHNEDELDRAIESGAAIVGVNNRDLHTFEVSLETSLRLAARMPAPVLRVSESGIHSAADIRSLHAAGYHAFLVGEHLMKAADPTDALKCLLA
jgi:indole-3-glycerol phosphate synthase